MDNYSTPNYLNNIHATAGFSSAFPNQIFPQSVIQMPNAIIPAWVAMEKEVVDPFLIQAFLIPTARD